MRVRVRFRARVGSSWASTSSNEVGMAIPGQDRGRSRGRGRIG